MAAIGVLTSRAKLSTALGTAEFLSDKFLTELANELLAIEPVALGVAAVSNVQLAIPHGLGRAPNFVGLRPQGNAVFWESQAADNTNVYVTASVVGPTNLIVVVA